MLSSVAADKVRSWTAGTNRADWSTRWVLGVRLLGHKLHRSFAATFLASGGINPPARHGRLFRRRKTSARANVAFHLWRFSYSRLHKFLVGRHFVSPQLFAFKGWSPQCDGWKILLTIPACVASTGTAFGGLLRHAPPREPITLLGSKLLPPVA
jgi:hypothetical protein